MTVVVDTGVFYAHHDTDSSRHKSAQNALSTVLDGQFGRPITSDYVYDETVTLTLSRFGDATQARTVGNRILGRDGYPDAIDLIFIGRDLFFAAVDVRERYADHGLSFTDATTIALVEHHDFDHVLSFDDDFDGLVSRLDPTDL